MKIYIVSIILLLSHQVFAYQASKKIHKIIAPEVAGQDFLILNSDGSVFFTDSAEYVAQLQAQSSYSFQIDEDHRITSGSLPTHPEESFNDTYDTTFGKGQQSYPPIQSGYKFPKGWENFRPTMVSSLSQLNRIFASMSRDVSRGSQCYHKAHFWSYNLARMGVKTGKAFIFFTKEYIINYNFRWWFHVAPTIQLNQNDFAILDRYFFNGPVTPSTWANNWVKSGANCPEIQHYDQYYRRQYNAHCYVRHMPMHYFEPNDIANLDRHGIRIDSWKKNDVAVAFRSVGHQLPEVDQNPPPVVTPRPPVSPLPPVTPIPSPQGCECGMLSDGSCGIWKVGKYVVLQTAMIGSCNTINCSRGFHPNLLQNQCGGSVVGLSQ